MAHWVERIIKAECARSVRASKRKSAMVPIVFLSALVAVLLALSGCVYSDTITERIIDNNPDSIIDYDLEPILINSITATETSDKLPKLEVDESEQQQDKEQDLPEFTDIKEQVTTSQQAPTPQYNPNATSSGTASNNATNTGNDNNASAGNQESEGDDGWADVDEQPDDTNDTEAEQSESDDQGTGKEDSGSGRKSGGSGDFYSDVPDMEEPEIPENIDEVVAFGNNAVIVSILTGSDSGSALIGCDSGTKNATSVLLANRGMGSVQGIDYSEGETMSSSAFKKLYKNIVPDMVYVTEGLNPFTTEQLETLAKKNISVYTLPALTSDTRIKFTFKVIAQTLEGGGVAGAQSRCDEYVSFINSIVDSYSNANGGLTGGYDFEEQREVDSNASELVTLVVDGWDANARFTNSKAGVLDCSSGVAVATLGYDESPVSYYLSAGGVLNNAASKKIRKVTTNGRGLVWQFASGQLSWSSQNWSSLSGRYIDLASKVQGGLFADSLLCYMDNHHGVGTELFPGLIAGSQEIAALLQSSAANPYGLYHAYGTISTAEGASTVGYFPSDGSDFYVDACIGRGSHDSSDIGEGGYYGIYINPRGLCQSSLTDSLCSWLAGSPESVLEASWAYWQFRGGDQSAFEQDVMNFYQAFYGYSLSMEELLAIEAGVAN